LPLSILLLDVWRRGTILGGMPQHFYGFMDPVKVDQLPVGPRWRYEKKDDGNRTMAYLGWGAIQLRMRDSVCTDQFSDIAEILPEAFPGHDVVVDGELIAYDAQGRQNRSLLRQRKPGDVQYRIFDILELDEEPLVKRSWLERQRALRKTFRSVGPVIELSQPMEDPVALLRDVLDNGLEGVVAKDIRATYLEGKKSRHMQKLINPRYVPLGTF
jgi:bifunctional non-homologous end joining protein LigD